MNAVATKSAVVAAKPVAARRQARAQVKVVASGQKKQEVAQRRTVFAGLAAAVVAAAIAPKQAQAEERSSETVSRLCSSNPTSKACLEESAKR
mmetsp:Transcript_22875/g.40714  ORF Transcript_22875/g.40714 Transcript_22875/m.40714 type:complete len:93 (-) Transcript_22875:423-701(-)|eukprot:CAMPEP_0168610982 /NCGR_PEP_ID=MMETSP0449_2-20121227/2097_1 /TAXON_ID=1082188 /ORGANISM="Strombidium rassoulzadegani, Strain ras09" /LENGTH=92 /DNA_ID=CAMNT_0008651363 /DNA_START=72 /DNA_END=350 /DNA_ORIENTATION=+